jgi:acetyl esterase/lipase
VRIAYGPDPSQFGELYLPDAELMPSPWPVIVIIHGGFWRERYDLSLGTPLAADLVRRGCAVWNIEYRRVGNGGGWPATFVDVAAAVDHLAVIAALGPEALRQARGASGEPAQGAIDLSRVIALGHSAGGHLAAWLGGRPRLAPPYGPPLVAVTGVVCQAAVLDLEAAGAARLGTRAVEDFAGGRMTTSDSWRIASPIRQLPLGVPIRCVHGDRDDTVPIEQSARYVASARLLGGDAELITVPGGDHYGVITPGDPGWTACAQVVVGLAAIS